jgi:putative hydrolase of the HAD superfamily
MRRRSRSRGAHRLNPITHIFFDIGGVLGSNGWDREQRAVAVDRFQLDPEDFQCRHEEMIGAWEVGRITIDEYLDIAVFHRPRDFSREEFMEFMYAQSKVNTGTVEIARSLTKRAGFTLMTLNNEADELNRYRIEQFGISDIFEAFLSSCWLGVRKPMQQFYSRALGIAQADPAASLFIDDRQQNLSPARELGMTGVLFTSAAQLRAELQQLLDLEIPGA